MPPRNHVEAGNARRNRQRPKKMSEFEYTILLALAGNSVATAAETLIRRLRGGMEAGDLHLSGSEDMTNAARDALVKLEQELHLYKDASNIRSPKELT